MHIGRNEPCSCGSGRKYKRCCGAGRPRQAVAVPAMTPAQSHREALRHFEAERLVEARRICESLLARSADDVDALNLLSVIASREGRYDAAAGLLERAITLLPREPQLRMNLGNVLRERGRAADAEAAFRSALRLAPGYVEAHYNLVLALSDQGRVADACEQCDRYLSLQPGVEPAWELAEALRQLEKREEAVHCYRRALRLSPDNAELLSDLGSALGELGQHTQAEALLREAIDRAPLLAQAHNNLGNLFLETNRLDAALACYRRTLEIEPGYAEAHYHIARVHLRRGELSDALDQLHTACRIKPDLAVAQWMTGLVLLIRGEYREGFRRYEWRWLEENKAELRRRLGRPHWQGEDIAGRSVLLYSEQGLGDMIQFARFAPLLAARGARVILECPAPLARLFRSLPGLAHVIARGESIPPYDLCCPLMSLAHWLDVTLDSLPAAVPYLQPPTQPAERWHGLAESGDPLRVGIAWAGNPQFGADARRSVSLAELAPLADLPGLELWSLQKGAGARDAEQGLRGVRIVDRTAELEDFADTAALMAHLDLVISVDTAVAHLAGALGRAVWLLNRFDSDWRWLLEREDSPWYPSMRIFRQTRPGDWGDVVVRVVAALRERLDERNARLAAGACSNGTALA